MSLALMFIAGWLAGQVVTNAFMRRGGSVLIGLIGVAACLYFALKGV